MWKITPKILKALLNSLWIGPALTLIIGTPILMLFNAIINGNNAEFDFNSIFPRASIVGIILTFIYLFKEKN